MSTIFGINPVLEALRTPNLSVERLFIDTGSTNPRLKEIVVLAKGHNVPVHYEPKTILTRKANSKAHQGAVAITSPIRYAGYEEILDQAGANPLLLILDGVQDPHNLGAIVRTADASGVRGIFIPQRRAASVTDTVVKTSAGATAHVKIARVVNIANLIDQLKRDGVWIVGMQADAASLWSEIDYNQPIALVLGEEGKGIHRLVRERCDFLVRIPMLGRVASLNVSVAAGVVLYEALRQRGAKAEDRK